MAGSEETKFFDFGPEGSLPPLTKQEQEEMTRIAREFNSPATNARELKKNMDKIAERMDDEEIARVLSNEEVIEDPSLVPKANNNKEMVVKDNEQPPNKPQQNKVGKVQFADKVAEVVPISYYEELAESNVPITNKIGAGALKTTGSIVGGLLSFIPGASHIGNTVEKLFSMGAEGVKLIFFY